MRAKRLTIDERRTIFSNLVAKQDEGSMDVPESRRHIIDQFSITDAQLKLIEEEGIDKQWPPLNEELAIR